MRRSPTADRVLATVLFTDIVGSTERAAELGDRRWRDLVARHHREVRAQLKRSAAPEQLESWGYPPLELPNIDDRIDLCHAHTSGAQVQCWAELDQYLMENVVPWVPYAFERHTRTVSARVVHYSFDQSIAMPALDQIAVPPDP